MVFVTQSHSAEHLFQSQLQSLIMVTNLGADLITVNDHDKKEYSSLTKKNEIL